MRAARLKRTSAAVQLPPGARRRFKLLPANRVWLKLEHSFKSEWLNTPGHLSQGHLEVNGFDFAPWHPWQKPAECEFSSGSSQMDAWKQKKKEKGTARCLLLCFWALAVKRNQGFGFTVLYLQLRCQTVCRGDLPWLTRVQRTKMDSPISSRSVSVMALGKKTCQNR